MSRRVRGRGARLALATLAASTAARAAPMGPTTEAVAVVALEADTVNEHAAKTLTNVLRGQVLDSEEYTLGGESQPLVATAYQVKCALRTLRTPLNDMTDLAFDARCLQRIGERLGVKRYFWGYVYSDGGKPYARVHFWQQGEPDRVLTLPYEPDRRQLVGERLYRKLATPGRVGDVTLIGPARLAGELYVGGQARGPYEPGVELTLGEGEHLVEVREGAKVLADARVRIVAGRRTVASVVEPDAAPPAPPPPAPAAPSEPARGRARAAWGWAAVAAGAASIGAGAAMSMRVKSFDDDFASDPAFVAYSRGARGDDMCEAAERDVSSPQPEAASPLQIRDRCGAASTARVLQYVLYGAGAALTGAGAYLLFTPSARASPSAKGSVSPVGWLWQPEVRPGGAGLKLGVRF